MQIDDILSQFDHSIGRFPRTAVREAVARREDLTPALLGVLEDAARDPRPFASEDRMVHIFAMYLLAQFRETRAYPLLVKIFSAPAESIHDLAGDVVTEGLGSILASVSGGDIGGMTALAENAKADEYVRAAALDGLLTLVACGLRNREEVMAYFDRLFDVFEPEPPMIWNGLASACADLWPEEVMDKIRRAYEEGYIEPGYIGWDDIQDALARGKDSRNAAAARCSRVCFSNRKSWREPNCKMRSRVWIFTARCDGWKNFIASGRKPNSSGNRNWCVRDPSWHLNRWI